MSLVLQKLPPDLVKPGWYGMNLIGAFSSIKDAREAIKLSPENQQGLRGEVLDLLESNPENTMIGYGEMPDGELAYTVFRMLDNGGVLVLFTLANCLGETLDEAYKKALHNPYFHSYPIAVEWLERGKLRAH